MLRRIRIPLLLFFMLYALGVYVFILLEGWSLIDAFYFVGTVLSALGHGNLYPVTTFGKIFTTIFGFAGITLFLYMISVVADLSVQRQIQKHLKKEKSGKR